MTAEFLLANIPLMVLFFALVVGIPMWMVLKRPDQNPWHTRTVPAYLSDRTPAPASLPVQRQVPAYGEDWQRIPVSADRK